MARAADGAGMKTVQGGWAFPDADQFMVDELRDGLYQDSHLTAALAHVTDWSIAVDGGAHVGSWSRLMSAKFQRVIAIEPSPDTFEALEANLVTFGCQNVDARNVALGAAAGWVSMTLDEVNAARKNTGGRFVQPDGTIPLTTLDAFDLPTLGFLKLDVEGSEFVALMGARKTIARCQPIILFENKGLWLKYGVERFGPQKLLTSLGYRQLERCGCDLIWGHA
jgi:FkbM family methyltransferase